MKRIADIAQIGPDEELVGTRLPIDAIVPVSV